MLLKKHIDKALAKGKHEAMQKYQQALALIEKKEKLDKESGELAEDYVIMEPFGRERV